MQNVRIFLHELLRDYSRLRTVDGFGQAEHALSGVSRACASPNKFGFPSLFAQKAAHINDCELESDAGELMRKGEIKARNTEDFSEAVFIRCPPTLREAIAEAAREQLTTAANYTRSAVISKLRADGFYPAVKRSVG